MAKLGLRYIGKTISIKAIRNFILDKGLSERDAIFLHPRNFDEIVLEYRNHYGEGIDVPFFLLRVLIEEGDEHIIPLDRVGVSIGDDRRFENDYSGEDEGISNYDYSDISIYRCGWCGNIVDYDGSEFDTKTRDFKIKIHQKHRDTIKEERVHGRCCPNGPN